MTLHARPHSPSSLSFHPASRLALAALLALSAAACEATVSVPDRGGPDPDATQDLPIGDAAVGNNSPPGPVEIALLPAEPGTLETLTVEIVVDATDPDGGPNALTYLARWYKDGELTLHESLSIPPQVTRRSETWRVEVRAFDGVAEGPVAAAEVEVLNTAPSLDAAGLEPAMPETDSLLICSTGTPEDADGDDVQLRWGWLVDGEKVAGAVTSAMAPPLKAGKTYKCTATPFDGQVEGETVTSGGVIPVDPNDTSDAPLLSFQPKSLDMGVVNPGEVNTRGFTVHNIGVAPLEIVGHQLTGDPFFQFLSELPVTIDPGESAAMEVSFATNDPGLKKGTLWLDSNAANANQVSLPLLGVGAAPCLQIQPSFVDFGGAYIASQHVQELSVLSCGALPVTIESIGFQAPADSPFKLDLSTGPGDLPWVLSPGQQLKLKVRFSPLKASPLDEEGNPIREKALISFQTALFGPKVDIQVEGFASALGCPNPVIDVEEGHFVAPGTTLFINGSKSFAPAGKPSIFSWSVTSPAGAPELELLPSGADESITYGPLTTLGKYLVQLKVFDDVDGQIVPGCGTASWTVEVKDAVPLIVEVRWDTPGDPNQTDVGPGVGADLDLHMHNNHGQQPDYDGDGQPDTWFDLSNDLFWFDTSPDWGEPGDVNDPLLVREDPDGLGPERIEYPLPLKHERYTVGVHCWSSFGFGPSVATVKVWHFESLVAEWTDVVLNTGDLWEVGTIDWPKGQLVPAAGGAGGPKVTPGYPNPF